MDQDCLIPVFPVEIFTNIIEFLHDDHAVDALKNCSVVNGWFQILCQPLLFSIVEIGEAHPRKVFGDDSGSASITAQQFADTMRRSPGIGLYIRSLEYTITLADFDIPHLNEALTQLHKIESLSISYYYCHDDWDEPIEPIAFERISMDWQTSPLGRGVLHLLGKPTLNYFRLGDTTHGFPAEYLVHCTNLKALSIDAGMVSSQAQSTISCAPIQLEQLTCSTGGRGGVMQALRTCQSNGTPILDITNLKLLSTPLLRDEWFDDPFIVQYAFKHAKNLEHLQLSFTSLTSCEGLCGDILTVKALQTIKVLDVLLLHATISVTDPYLGLCRELVKMSGKNNIQELKIGVTLQSLDGARESAFSELDEATSGTGWPCLKKARLSIQIPQRGSVESEHKALLQTLRTTRFPRLASSHTVVFECVPDIGRLF